MVTPLASGIAMDTGEALVACKTSQQSYYVFSEQSPGLQERLKGMLPGTALGGPEKARGDVSPSLPALSWSGKAWLPG